MHAPTASFALHLRIQFRCIKNDTLMPTWKLMQGRHGPGAREHARYHSRPPPAARWHARSRTKRSLLCEDEEPTGFGSGGVFHLVRAKRGENNGVGQKETAVFFFREKQTGTFFFF
jgi:hypothetical protein